MFLNYFIIISTSLAVLYMVIVFVQKRKDVKFLYKIKRIFNEFDINGKVEIFDYDNPFQVSMSSETCSYFIKVINMNPKHELIITNSHKWGINANVKNWKRSVTPNFIEKTKEFIKIPEAVDRKIYRIALINPNCHNIVKYLNESDAVVVDETNPVDGVYFVKSQKFEDFLKNQ